MNEYGQAGEAGPDLHRPEVHAALDHYWRKNLRVTALLLVLWMAAGLGCGVLIADVLNRYRLPGTGYPLGFWFAHQGAIIVFIFLILIYCIFMNRLDSNHHQELERLQAGNKSDR